MKRHLLHASLPSNCASAVERPARMIREAQTDGTMFSLSPKASVALIWRGCRVVCARRLQFLGAFITSSVLGIL